MITDRRMEYLLLFATRTSKGRSISDAAEEFGVSLPSASSISATLERDGLIRKAGGGVVELTPPAWELVTPKLAQMRRLEEWLEAGVGLLPGHAEREARRMAACLRDDTVEGIIRYWLCRETGGRTEELNRFFQTLTPGTYQVPFSVYKKDRRELSMGDRGFRKPANWFVRKVDAPSSSIPLRSSARWERRRKGGGRRSRGIWSVCGTDRTGSGTKPNCLRTAAGPSHARR